MDRHVLRSLGLVGALGASFALAVATGSAPAAALGALTATGASPSALPMAPGLRAEPIIADAPPALAELADPVESSRTSATAIDTPKPEPAKPARARTVPAPRTYSGRNHVWSSALGLDRSVSAFACSRSRPPDMAIYRWGCAGQNNVYLFAHAGGPFRRLHDLYVRGGLRRGMTLIYADPSGTVHRFKVAWWKVVLPTNGAFAYAAQSRSSMTLQTCVGANDRYRLVVRLHETD